MGQKSNSKKNFFICLSVFGVAAVALFFLYMRFRPSPTQGSKTVTVEVVYEDSATETYTVQTEANYLEQAIAEMEGLTIDGTRSDAFGLMILTVNGVEADYNKNQAYWAISLDDTPCNYGVSQQPIEDGQCYRLIYTAGDAS